MTKYRSRSHMLLLYPSNEEHMKAYSIIEKSYDYASIIHNKDIAEDGTPKKEHIHIILRFNQPRWSSAICKDLGIEERFIEEVKKFDNALQYLIHYNDTDKAQYDINDVKGNLKARLIESINKVEKSEGEKVRDLIQYIRESADYITITEFASFCAENGYWSEFRRSGSIFCKIIEEHNYLIQSRQNKKD